MCISGLIYHEYSFCMCQIRLNNRKARLARTARDVRPTADVDYPVPDKHRGPVGSCDSPDSPSDTSNARKDLLTLARIASGDNPESSLAEAIDDGPPEFVQFKAGQSVVLVDAQGEEVGKGKVFQVRGKWHEKSLDESETCVVDVCELKADKGLGLPYPSEFTGTSFADTVKKIGVMRVLWDSNKLYVSRSQ